MAAAVVNTGVPGTAGVDRISAVIPTFNRACYLPDVLSALLEQSRPLHEVIVVDDGSTDDTGRTVAEFGSRVRYVRQQNQGKSAALNTALATCTGGSVWICDDDDVPVPDGAAWLLDGLVREQAGFCFGRYERFSIDPADGKREVFDAGYWPDLDGNRLLLTLMEDFFLFQNATLVRRSAYDAVGPFRTDLVRSQDYEMALRLALRFEGAHVPRVVFRQRVHDGARGSNDERFSADRQFEKWMQYDAVIIGELYRTLPLETYLPKGMADAPPPVQRRACLLQRACILARRKLWREALDDLERALALAPQQPLDAVEIDTCRRFLLSKYGCGEILADQEIGGALRRLAGGGENAARAVRVIAEPLLWRAREAVSDGDLEAGMAFAGLLARLRGLRGSSHLIWSAMRRRSANRATGRASGATA